MSLKIVMKLSGAHDDCISDLLHLRIILLDPVRTSKTKYTGNYCFVVLPSFATSFSLTTFSTTTVATETC
jgi:hypothetical protein